MGFLDPFIVRFEDAFPKRHFPNARPAPLYHPTYPTIDPDLPVKREMQRGYEKGLSGSLKRKEERDDSSPSSLRNLLVFIKKSLDTTEPTEETEEAAQKRADAFILKCFPPATETLGETRRSSEKEPFIFLASEEVGGKNCVYRIGTSKCSYTGRHRISCRGCSALDY